jgi:hypothetical protein
MRGARRTPARCQLSRALFDHLVGAADQRVGDGDTKGLGGLEIDGQLDLGYLLDRQVGGLFALEDAGSIDAGLPVRVPDIATVAHQAAGCREIAHGMDSRHSMLERQSGKLLCATIEKYVGGDDEPANLKLGQLLECGFDVAFGAGIKEMKLQSQSAGGSL